MQALVTGGTGLLGRHLVEALLQRRWDVTVLTRNPDRAGDLASRGVHVAVGELPRADLRSALASLDVLFHCAAWYEVGVRDARRMYDVNVTGTSNVLAQAREARVPRIVYTSTAGLFPASRDQPSTEASAPVAATDDPYVTSKLQAHALAVREMQSGLPLTVVAPAAAFGPWDTGQLAQGLARLVQGRLGTLPAGFGMNTWTHAADVAEGLLLAGTVGQPGELYFLGDRVLSMYAFFEAAAAAAGVPPPRRRVPMGLARLAARFSEMRARGTGRAPMLSRAALELSSLDVVVDSSKARRELGWSPRPFDERVRETMAWYLATYGRKGTPFPLKPGGASGAGRPRGL